MCEADHSPPYSAKVKNCVALSPLPIRLHGVVLTGTILPLLLATPRLERRTTSWSSVLRVYSLQECTSSVAKFIMLRAKNALQLSFKTD
jgi:hypothetical protein